MLEIYVGKAYEKYSIMINDYFFNRYTFEKVQKDATLLKVAESLMTKWSKETGYYLLQTIAGNYFANKKAIEAIAEHCTSEGVLLNIVSNKDIPKEIRDKASKRISDIKYWYLF